MIETVEKKYNPISNEFDTYKMIKDGITYYVPLDEANSDYQAIQEWAKIEGNNIIDPGA
jgi:glucan phosphorylase